MVVNDLDDPNRSHAGKNQPATRPLGKGIVVWLENKARWAAQVEGVLTCPIAAECVEASRASENGCQGWGCLQDGDPPTEHLPVLGPKPAHPGAVARTILGQLAVDPRNVNLTTSCQR
jgi:hypothetical protein